MEKAKRICGPCTLCCTHLEIASKPGYSTRIDNGEDLAKKAGRSCTYLSASGCSIYAVRPPVCRQFACDWLKGKKEFREENSPLATNSIGLRGTILCIKNNSNN